MSTRRQWQPWAPRPDARPRHRFLRRALAFALVAVLTLLGLGVGGVWWATNHYGDQVTRIPHAFPQGPRRPADGGGTTLLRAGVDSRSRKPTTGTEATTRLWAYGAQRSDTLMLVRLDAGERTAYTMSIPRDSWVPIPGHGSAKVNAAFSRGGPPLLIQTVEQLTGVRVDHFGVIDSHRSRPGAPGAGAPGRPGRPPR